MNDNQKSLQDKLQDICSNTCGTWQNCNETNMVTFLTKCNNDNIDPQYCMGWVEQHKEEIPNWHAISGICLSWINQHTSTGSPIQIDENLS